MIKFIIGLIIIVAAIVGAYYYFTIKQADAIITEQPGVAATAEVQVNKKIPAGAVMEDGTIPE